MKIVLAGIAALLFAACTSLGQQPPPKTVFDFGLPAEPLVNAVAPAGVVLDLRAPAWIDTPRIAYRLAYRDASERHEYVESRWAGPAGSLLGQRLRQRLGLAASGGACVLRLGVDEFGQVFEAPQTSSGIVRLQAQLLDSRGRVVAQAAFGGEAAAATADARGGVTALRAALDRASAQLNDWLAGAALKPVLAACA